MDKQRFTNLIVKGKYRLEHRELLVTSAITHPELILALLENMKKVDEKDSVYSARILELAVKKNVKVLLPYINEFSKLLTVIKFDGSVRASAKLIEICCINYFIKNNPVLKEKLTDDQLELFTEACFDWMIADSAIAIQAHAMYSLYLLGEKFDWVHPELIQIIDKNIPNASTGYQNRGKKIIKAIKANTLLKLY